MRLLKKTDKSLGKTREKKKKISWLRVLSLGEKLGGIL